MTQDQPDPMALRDYVAAKQLAGDVVRGVVARARVTGDPALIDDSKGLLAKLAEDRFNLAVVGAFKRGKSSLMNAIIGRELLPTGLLPLTSVITALRYGPREAAWLRHDGWAVEQEIPVEQLADFVTERGNPGNEKRVIEARVELPVKFLRRGLHFVDTPGVGSSHVEKTSTAYRFLPEADAVIFVTGVDAPMSEVEERYLATIRGLAPKLFLVANKVDTVSAPERDEGIAYLAERATTILGSPTRVYPVSARGALAARKAQDRRALEQCGILELEADLTSFLAFDRGRAFLVGILDRAAAILGEAVGLRPSVAGYVADGVTMADLVSRTGSLRQQLAAGRAWPLPAESARSTRTDRPSLNAAVASASGARARHVTADRPRGTCTVCAAQVEAIFAFFARWQHDLATSEQARDDFVAAGGFCPSHMWQLEQFAAPRDLSVAMAPLIRDIKGALERARGESVDGAHGTISALLERPMACAACGVLSSAALTATTRYVESFNSPAGNRDPSEMLCLEHLSGALASRPSDEPFTRRMLDEHVRGLEELIEDLQGFSLKRDAVRRSLVSADEAAAWRRAITQVAGERAARGAVRPRDAGRLGG